MHSQSETVRGEPVRHLSTQILGFRPEFILVHLDLGPRLMRSVLSAQLVGQEPNRWVNTRRRVRRVELGHS